MENNRYKYSDIFEIAQYIPKYNAFDFKETWKSNKEILPLVSYFRANRLNNKLIRWKRITPARFTRKPKLIKEYNQHSLITNNNLIQFDKGIFPCSQTVISPRIPIKIGDISVGPGVNLSYRDTFSGINFTKLIDNDVIGHIDNGVFIIKGFSK